MLLFDDTIAAISTPAGRGGIGIVRISGPATREIVSQLAPRLDLTAIQRAQLTELRELASGNFLDDAVITYFQAPRSYTGQDVAEISCHGSPFILSQVLRGCLSLGARSATPGEFTMRAFVNGRIDLTQAEAVRDLIDAQTDYQARLASRQLKGELSRYLQPVKDELLQIIVQLESAVEFVEENLDTQSIDTLAARIQQLVERLARLAESYQVGRIVRDGINMAIIGRPNVGKSSLFNALLQQDRAIVTEIPGTTRDSLSERASIGGIPVNLVDTAGIREAGDIVEQLGIERSYSAMADADLILLVLDGSCELAEEDLKLLAECRAQRATFVVVINKLDLTRRLDDDTLRRSAGSAPIFAVSARSHDGIEAMQQAIVAQCFQSAIDTRDDLLIVDARHFSLLKNSIEELQAGVARLREGFTEEVALCHLHNALKHLGEITGETTLEDILGRIFETFCIGK